MLQYLQYKYNIAYFKLNVVTTVTWLVIIIIIKYTLLYNFCKIYIIVQLL